MVTSYHKSLLSIYSVLILFFLSCSDTKPGKKATNLIGNSIRGKVISLDTNNSFAEIELLARSNDLSEKLSGSIGSKMKFQVQPGDLTLLKEQICILGGVTGNIFPCCWKNISLTQHLAR
jgi:hypothetical protein